MKERTIEKQEISAAQKPGTILQSLLNPFLMAAYSFLCLSVHFLVTLLLPIQRVSAEEYRMGIFSCMCVYVETSKTSAFECIFEGNKGVSVDLIPFFLSFFLIALLIAAVWNIRKIREIREVNK